MRRDRRSAKKRQADRKRLNDQKQWLLDSYGDGIMCKCVRCGKLLVFENVTRDRIIPGALGGQYVLDNIRPMCADCNSRHGTDGKEIRSENEYS